MPEIILLLISFLIFGGGEFEQSISGTQIDNIKKNKTVFQKISQHQSQIKLSFLPMRSTRWEVLEIQPPTSLQE